MIGKSASVLCVYPLLKNIQERVSSPGKEVAQRKEETMTVLDHVPLAYRSVPALQTVLEYDERSYPLCPNCKQNVTRTFLCRLCMLKALEELNKCH